MLFVPGGVFPPGIVGKYGKPLSSLFHEISYVIAVNAFVANQGCRGIRGVHGSGGIGNAEGAGGGILIERNSQRFKERKVLYEGELFGSGHQFGFMVQGKTIVWANGYAGIVGYVPIGGIV